VRIAALYDIHGNLPALDAVLTDIERDGGIDLLIIGGDVYPGPMANEALSRIKAAGIPFRALCGNGERLVLETVDGTRTESLPAAAVAGIEWCATNLTPTYAHELRGWPPTLRVGRVSFVHATPRNDTEIFTERTPDDVARTMFADAEAEIVVCGHTHIQFERRLAHTRIINAGSVGMPFDEPAAYWAVIDDDVTLRRTSYDRRAAADVLRRSTYPAVDQFVEQFVLDAPSRARMLDVYAGASTNVRQRDASSPVASDTSTSTTSKPSSP